MNPYALLLANAIRLCAWLAARSLRRFLRLSRWAHADIGAEQYDAGWFRNLAFTCGQLFVGAYTRTDESIDFILNKVEPTRPVELAKRAMGDLLE